MCSTSQRVVGQIAPPKSMHHSFHFSMYMICNHKVLLGDASLPQTVKFSDVSRLQVLMSQSPLAYKTRLNRQETSKREGVKLSDSLIAIYTAAETSTAACPATIVIHNESMRFIVALVATLFILSAASADTLKVATWNIEHLRDGIGEGPNPRQPEDFQRLAQYVEILNADVIAFQEVENLQAARKVFKPATYQLFIENRHGPLHTGFAVRHGFTVTQHPDLTALNVTGGLRHGTDITVIVSNQEIRLLSVHLKPGCWGKSLNSNTSDCKKLKRQVSVLETWIDARAAEEIPFIVLGDFNRRFDVPGDEFWPEIDDGKPLNADLHRITEGKQQDCWDGAFTHFIDHIVFDKTSRRWIKPYSFEEIVYQENKSLKKKLSDHCPVAMTLEIR